ncbi:Siderophore biosynthesis protein [Staphylococcus piscifermentans]|uniref:Uncharacterized protein n=1 Tax=Staphylococcus piscifermentans TaxID=70258 RepID=A0A239TV31_9STAP|nr:IucA/IucC family protein [Staphylococcus piscifermentans]RTX85556.1 sialic acid synthase [Staphylococcus piscifermentans]GEP85762.1 hypothetical protein SPI02_23470 [Staphylococcus piscifermentans]SNV00513.1 Siderophore biosynthesis protein [Staphylococcus piscifermentans]
MNNNLESQNINDLSLTKEEQSAYDYLAESHPKWADAFQTVLMQARDLISKRLIVSIYRENMVGQGQNSEIISAEELPFTLSAPTGKIMKMIWPRSGKILYAPISGFHAFDRIDMEAPFYFSEIETEKVQRIQHPEEVLEVILTEAPEYKGAASNQFSDDLMNSAANMAMALSYQHLALQDEDRSMLEIIANHIDSYLRSEQAVVEGHPLHPGAKLRKGLSPEMNFQYSSEFHQPQHLNFIAVHKDLTRTQSLGYTYNELIFQAFPGLDKAFKQSLTSDQQDDYRVMILHPWQYLEVLHRDYQDEIARGLIVDIPYDTTYYAGLSFRTLMPKLPIITPHVKLSTNVHITGEIRTLSEQTTFNGPLVTEILEDIMHKDMLFNDINSSPIPETAGIHFYNSDDKGEHQTTRSEQLGSLLRTNIYQLADKETINLIPSSLVAYNPNQGEAVVNSLIHRAQFAGQHADFETAARAWLSEYAQALLDMVIPLLVKYGIALEAHLQNAIASFNPDGTLNHMFIRDFEGLRIDEAQLNRSGYSTEHFHEKSRILTNKPASVFNKAFYSTVQNHLGELILTIAQHTEQSVQFENALWEEIRIIIQEKFKTMRASREIEEQRLKEIEDIFFDKKIDYKCVTTMRLEDEAHEYTYVKVDNPLHTEK